MSQVYYLMHEVDDLRAVRFPTYLLFSACSRFNPLIHQSSLSVHTFY